MRNPKTGLCPPCQRWIHKVPARNYLWLVLVLAAVGTASSQFNLLIAFIIGNVLLAILLDIPVTVIHEAGHWLAGRLAGLRLVSIHIGLGAVRRCFKVGSVWCYFQSPPLGGLAMAANFALALLLWPYIQSSQVWYRISVGTRESTRFSLCSCSGVNNLWPGAVDMGEDLHYQTDGMIIWNCLKASPKYSPILIQQIALMNCDVYRTYGNFEAELLMFEQLAPEPNRRQKFKLLLLLLRLKRTDQALEIAQELLEPDPESSPEQRCLELSNLAWAYYQGGNLETADRLSAESLQICPGVASIMGTRGEVLAALGRFEEGRELLERSVATTCSPASAALNCKALSRLAALGGDRTEFDRLKALILRLNPSVDYYRDPDAALQEARIGRHALGSLQHCSA